MVDELLLLDMALGRSALVAAPTGGCAGAAAADGAAEPGGFGAGGLSRISELMVQN